MFTIAPAPEFSGEVPITRLGEEEPALLRCTFRHLTVTKAQALDKRIETDGLTWFQVLQEIVVSWEVQRADESTVDFNEAGYAELSDSFPMAGRDIYLGYLDALRKGRLGN
jgi:hypothetical protein